MEDRVHFDFSISLGSILTIVTITAGVIAILHRFAPVMRILMEHDLMWADFIDRNPHLAKGFNRRQNG